MGKIKVTVPPAVKNEPVKIVLLPDKWKRNLLRMSRNLCFKLRYLRRFRLKSAEKIELSNKIEPAFYNE
jgi:hypothetical protein